MLWWCVVFWCGVLCFVALYCRLLFAEVVCYMKLSSTVLHCAICCSGIPLMSYYDTLGTMHQVTEMDVLRMVGLDAYMLLRYHVVCYK